MHTGAEQSPDLVTPGGMRTITVEQPSNWRLHVGTRSLQCVLYLQIASRFFDPVDPFCDCKVQNAFQQQPMLTISITFALVCKSKGRGHRVGIVYLLLMSVTSSCPIATPSRIGVACPPLKAELYCNPAESLYQQTGYVNINYKLMLILIVWHAFLFAGSSMARVERAVGGRQWQTAMPLGLLGPGSFAPCVRVYLGVLVASVCPMPDPKCVNLSCCQVNSSRGTLVVQLQ